MEYSAGSEKENTAQGTLSKKNGLTPCNTLAFPLDLAFTVSKNLLRTLHSLTSIILNFKQKYQKYNKFRGRWSFNFLMEGK